MKYRTFETGLAWFSLVGAFVHFVLETLYHIAFGQFLPLLVVDYIAVGLLVYSGVLSLKVRPSSASGLLWPARGGSPRASPTSPVSCSCNDICKVRALCLWLWFSGWR